MIRTNDNITRRQTPNSSIARDQLTLWGSAGGFAFRVGVAYGSDIGKVREALLAAGRENPNTLKDPAPSVFLEKFGDNSIDFDLVVWSSEMSARPSRYRSDLNFAIERKFREAGIEIAFPQRDLHIRSGVLKVEGIDSGTTKRPESPRVWFTSRSPLRSVGGAGTAPARQKDRGWDNRHQFVRANLEKIAIP